MKHKWMTLLVVIVTTMTTAQEALKQYDSLKAQAERWATLRLWTGFLNAYAPQEEEETPAAQQIVTCSVNPMPRDDARSHESLMHAATSAIRYAETRMRDETSRFAPALVSAIEVEHHKDDAPVEAAERIREVALLQEAGEPEAEETVLRDAEAEPVDTPDDEMESVATLRALREVRFISRAASLEEVAEAASPASDADSVGATKGSARAAARTKAKAMRRVLKTLQFHLDRAARAEPGAHLRDAKVKLTNAIETASLAGIESGLIAAVSPTATQTDTSPRPPAAIGDNGGCASE